MSSRVALLCSMAAVVSAACPSGKSGVMGTRIVGGTEVQNPREFPFQVSLQEGNSHFCGGSLIAPGWVLTAAHCGNVKVVEVGGHDLSANDACVERIKVSETIIHPKYDDYTMANDIALLKLAGASTYPPVGLYSGGALEAAGTLSTVSGWGTLSSGGPAPDVLRSVNVPIVTNKVCNVAYSNGIIDTMMCAGYKQGGKDSCQGDSGGPLFVSEAGQFVQTGVVSWGEGCAAKNKYGVYTRVSSFNKWICKTAGVACGGGSAPTPGSGSTSGSAPTPGSASNPGSGSTSGSAPTPKPMPNSGSDDSSADIASSAPSNGTPATGSGSSSQDAGTEWASGSDDSSADTAPMPTNGTSAPGSTDWGYADEWASGSDDSSTDIASVPSNATSTTGSGSASQDAGTGSADWGYAYEASYEWASGSDDSSADTAPMPDNGTSATGSADWGYADEWASGSDDSVDATLSNSSTGSADAVDDAVESGSADAVESGSADAVESGSQDTASVNSGEDTTGEASASVDSVEAVSEEQGAEAGNGVEWQYDYVDGYAYAEGDNNGEGYDYNHGYDYSEWYGYTAEGYDYTADGYAYTDGYGYTAEGYSYTEESNNAYAEGYADYQLQGYNYGR